MLRKTRKKKKKKASSEVAAELITTFYNNSNINANSRNSKLFVKRKQIFFTKMTKERKRAKAANYICVKNVLRSIQYRIYENSSPRGLMYCALTKATVRKCFQWILIPTRYCSLIHCNDTESLRPSHTTKLNEYMRICLCDRRTLFIYQRMNVCVRIR